MSETAERTSYGQSTFFVPAWGFAAFAPAEVLAGLADLQKAAVLLLGAPWSGDRLPKDDAPVSLSSAREVLRAALVAESARPKRAEPLWRLSDTAWAEAATDAQVAVWLEGKLHSETLGSDPAATARHALDQVKGQLVLGLHMMLLALDGAGQRVGRRALHAGTVAALQEETKAALDVDLAIAAGAYVPSAAQLADCKGATPTRDLFLRAEVGARVLPQADRESLGRALGRLASRTLKGLLADSMTEPSDQLEQVLDSLQRWLLTYGGPAHDWHLLAAGRAALGRHYARHLNRDMEAAAQLLRAAALGNAAAEAELNALSTEADAAQDETRVDSISAARRAFSSDVAEALASGLSRALPDDRTEVDTFVPGALRDLQAGWERFCADVGRVGKIPRFDRWTARRWLSSWDDGWIKVAAIAGVVCLVIAYVREQKLLAAEHAREVAYAHLQQAADNGDIEAVRAAGRAFLATQPDVGNDTRLTHVTELYRAALLEAANAASSTAQLADIFRENGALAKAIPAE